MVIEDTITIITNTIACLLDAASGQLVNLTYMQPRLCIRAARVVSRQTGEASWRRSET
jgi:hypothetical protein